MKMPVMSAYRSADSSVFFDYNYSVTSNLIEVESEIIPAYGIKSRNARRRNEKRNEKKKKPGQGKGANEGMSNTGITCYSNYDCSGSTRQFTSAHNCCKWGKSWSSNKNGGCVSCRQSQRVGNSKH